MKSGLSNTNIYHLAYREVYRQVVLRLANASSVSKDVNHSCVSAQAPSEVGDASFTVTRCTSSFKQHITNKQYSK